MLPDAWLKRGLLACLLWPISLFFRLAVAVREFGFKVGINKAESLPVPVIVVGNVLVGGTGKTPLLIATAIDLKRRGYRPGVISRGYGRESEETVEVLPVTPPAHAGDEPILIRRATGVPVFVAPRRIDAGRALLQAHSGCDVILCDDGLQHLALHRDLEICVFDNRGVGNGWMIPAGPLREPWPRPVDMVMHTGDKPAFDGYRGVRSLAPYAVNEAGESFDLASLRDKQVHALAGIARPEEFFRMLREAGVQLVATYPLRDHADLSTWKSPAPADAILVCTEKDAPKLWKNYPDALAVPLRFTPEKSFLDEIDRRLRRYHQDHGQQTS